MQPGRLAAALALIVVASSGREGAAQSPSQPRFVESLPGPARVLLTTDKPTCFLGENVLVHYCIEPATAQPIGISMGGDYRGGSRSNRFKMVVTDEQGVRQPDPNPLESNEGGISSLAPPMKQGERWCQSLPLTRYARIEQAGTYRVQVTHDLGWPAGQAPGGETTLTLNMPTRDEAARVVATMESLPAADQVGWPGKISPPYQDFSTLRYGVYLEPLLGRARAGLIGAVTGIGSIPTPEATRALIELLSASNRMVGRAAARWLAFRLPDPELTGALAPRNSFMNSQSSPRSYLVKAAWRPEFAPGVRTAARTLLGSREIGDVIEGAFFLEAVGTSEDAPSLSAALTSAIERTMTEPAETNQYPPPRGAAAELMRAADMLIARGYAPGQAAVETPGDLVLALVGIGQGARPDNWQSTVGRALQHRIPYVRQIALDKIKEDVPDVLVPLVALNLDQPDIEVRTSACRLISRAKLTTLVPQVTDIARKATQKWLLNAAMNALFALSNRVGVLKLAAERLAEPDVALEMFSTLTGVLESDGEGGETSKVVASAKVLSERWLTFIDAHRDELERGQRLSLDRTDIPVDLVPEGWKLFRRGKPAWPPGR